MSNEIAKTGTGTEVATAEEARNISATQRLQLLREAMLNPEVQPEKAIAMANLMFQLEDRDAKARFIEAKVAAIAAMPRITKDGKSNHGPYATWDEMQPRINPILTAHGLALNFEIGQTDKGQVMVTPILSGFGWEERGGPMTLPSDTSGNKNNVQAVGSAVQYGKRYAAMAILNIVTGGLADMDDDGSAAGGTPMDAYSLLSDADRELVDQGREKAKDGSAAYEDWFKALSTNQRGILTFNKADFETGRTWHGQNKDAAAAFDGNAQ